MSEKSRPGATPEGKPPTTAKGPDHAAADPSAKSAPDSQAPARPVETSPAADNAAAEAAPAAQAAAPAEPTTPTESAAPAKPAAPAEPVAAAAPAEDECKKPGTKEYALVVDDEPANRDFLVRLLEQANLEVRGASTGEEALQIAAQVECMKVVAIDNKLPDMNGVELVTKFRERYPNARLIMATMLDERDLMIKAFEYGCDVFLVKPHGFMELFRRLQTPGEEETLDKLIIDQYGPRPYRG
jgi:CheY-like chemotaxis protein